MPYIDPEDRPDYRAIDDLPISLAKVRPGDLNYVLTRIIDKALGPKPRYADINAAIGALECCKLELYRRIAAPLEDDKIAENGDVYRYRPPT